jgi:putative transposase
MEQQAVRPFLDLTPGSIVHHEGEVYIVELASGFDDIKCVHAVTNEQRTFSESELSPPALDTPIQKNAVEFLGVSDNDWEVAEHRLKVIRPLVMVKTRTRHDVVKAAKRAKVSTASFYRWLTAYEKTLRLSSLLPKQKSDGLGTYLLLPAVEALIIEAMENKYKKKGHRRYSAVYKDVKTYCLEQHLPVPSRGTIRNRCDSIPAEEKMRSQVGRRAARDKFKQIRGKFPDADTPHAIWQIDHTQLRQAVLHDNRLGSAGRPWITLIIDCKTTVIVGFYLTLDAPDINSVGIAMSQAILKKDAWLAERMVDCKWPVWGEPGTVMADNAGEFHEPTLKAATLDLDIRMQWRPVKNPSYGAHIESFCGTLKEYLDGEIPGTGSRHLADLQEHQPDKEAVMTLAELEAYITKYICEVYNKSPKASLDGRSPMKVYEHGIFGDDKTPGIGIPIIRRNERDIRLNFLPFELVTVQQYGIRWDLDYQAPCLRRWVRSLDPKTKKTRHFVARRDRRDISVIYFHDPEDNEYYDIPYADPKQAPMTLHELRAAKRKLRDEGRDDKNDVEVFKSHAELNAQVKDAELRTKTARREHTKSTYAKKRAASDQKMLRKDPPAKRDPATAQTPAELAAALAALDFTKVKPFTDD